MYSTQHCLCKVWLLNGNLYKAHFWLYRLLHASIICHAVQYEHTELLSNSACNPIQSDNSFTKYVINVFIKFHLLFLVKFKSTFNEHGTIVLSLFCDRQTTRFSFNLLKLTSLNLTYLTLTFTFLLPTKLPPSSSRTYYKLFVYLLLCTTKFSRVLISVTVCLPITTA